MTLPIRVGLDAIWGMPCDEVRSQKSTNTSVKDRRVFENMPMDDEAPMEEVVGGKVSARSSSTSGVYKETNLRG